MKTQFKKFLTFLILFCSFMFFTSCNSNKISEPTTKVICVLFDLSETTNTPEIRRTYLDKFKLILSKMNHGDAIEAALITERSVSELNLPIEHSFPLFSPTVDTDLMIKAQKRIADSLLQVQKDSLLKVADSVLFNPPRRILRTEILSSLQVAERMLSSFPQQKKILVIFSDMIEESRTANFAREDLSDAQIKSIIKRLKQSGPLPGLKNVKIYVAGAAHPNTDKYNQIRNFWFAYFKETGANLVHYGAALIRFDE